MENQTNPNKTTDKKNLGSKVLDSAKYLGKNSWKAIPGVGYFVYGLAGTDLDKKEGVPSWKRGLKAGGHMLWTAVAGTYLIVGGFTDLGWNPAKYDEMAKKSERQEEIKSTVENYVNDTNKEISHKEQSKIYNLMGIEDSSKTYKPTAQDWKRAYENIKEENQEFIFPSEARDSLYKKAEKLEKPKETTDKQIRVNAENYLENPMEKR